jgi:beta-galactosidase
MGCNAIRTAHNPPAPELLDLCDRMGMLVMDEAFDCWESKKKVNDYHTLFNLWHERDLRAMVCRDRNHPSIIFWSIGNEVREQRQPEGWKLSPRLASIVREEDRTRMVTGAFNMIESGYNGFQEDLDVFGYNYKPEEYAVFHSRNPLVPLLGSETASTLSSRGEYYFPVNDVKSEGRANFQVSSYDLYAPRWGTTPDIEFAAQDSLPYVIGEFVWSGFDYLGEPTPYAVDATSLLNFDNPSLLADAAKEMRERGKISVPSRSSYFGIFDLAGFKKDRFYLYQGRWRPELPMVHILPHWTWSNRIGEVTPVHVYTSGDEVEIFLNGRSLGRKVKPAFSYRIRWNDIRYEPGELRAVAYKDGKRWAEETIRTATAPAKILITIDKNKLVADGQDLAYAELSIVDAVGTLIPQAKDWISIHIKGPVGIAGVDNGDPTSLTPFRSDRIRAYNGRALIILRPQFDRIGEATLTVDCEGIQSQEVSLDIMPRMPDSHQKN